MPMEIVKTDGNVFIIRTDTHAQETFHSDNLKVSRHSIKFEKFNYFLQSHAPHCEKLPFDFIKSLTCRWNIVYSHKLYGYYLRTVRPRNLVAPFPNAFPHNSYGTANERTSEELFLIARLDAFNHLNIHS